jgi:predicted  nucleic acid-binding Zn-ribbon protein
MKSGDILGAQKLILAEVEAQVGGTAAASATGFDRMRVAVGNVAEEFGAILIPYIERFANFVINSVVPYMQRLAEVAGKEGIGGVIRTLAGDFLNMTTNMGAVGNTILGLVTGFVMLKAAALAFSVAQSAATIAVTAFGVAWNATGIGLVAAAIAAVVIGLIALYVKFEGVRKVVNLVGTALKFVFVTIAKSVFNVFATAINALILAPINAVLWVLKKFGADVETVGFISMQSFDMMGDAAEEAAKRMSAAQKKAGRPFEQLVGDYRGEMPKLVKATNDSFVGTGGAGKAVETAKEKLKKFIDALKGVTGAQRSYRDAMKGITKANEDLTVANDRLAKAQENFRQVVAGFGIDSRQGRAQRQVVVQAQRALERAGYGVEEAVFAVAQAEQELAEIRLDPDANATAIRQAEIDLAEAKLRVQEATDSQAEATQELADAQSRLDEVVNGAKEGSQAYKDALDELKEAQKAQQDAIDAVTDAYERQRDAVDALREAEEKLAELRKTTPDKIESKANKMLNTPLNIASPNMELPDNVFTSARRNAMLDAIPAFAAGGLVTSPTIGLIGEAGAEAVVPLDRLESGMNITLNINAGMGTDAAALGDEIVNVLQRYNRRNGALPLKVA